MNRLRASLSDWFNFWKVAKKYIILHQLKIVCQSFVKSKKKIISLIYICSLTKFCRSIDVNLKSICYFIFLEFIPIGFWPRNYWSEIILWWLIFEKRLVLLWRPGKFEFGSYYKCKNNDKYHNDKSQLICKFQRQSPQNCST